MLEFNIDEEAAASKCMVFNFFFCTHHITTQLILSALSKVCFASIGTMTIGFRATKKTSSALLGKLSGFNIWRYAVTAEEILRMSYGCGTEAGDAKAWETVRNGLIKEVEVKFSRTCNDRKGKSCAGNERSFEYFLQ